MSSNIAFAILLGITACLGQFASDVYAPAIPHIAELFGVSVNLAQFSMPMYMLGLCSSLLVFGTLSEAYGRRRPLLVGLMLMLLGSLVCALATNIELLLVGRVLQGIGAGSGAAMWRAMFRDRFDGADLAKYGAYLTILVTFVIPAAPMLGGFIMHLLGWRAVFAAIILYALTMWLAVYFLIDETSNNYHKDHLNIHYIIKSYGSIFKNSVFSGYSFCVFCCYGAYFSWFTVAPVLLIKHAHLSPAMFGWLCFWGGAVALFLGGLIGGKLVKRLGSVFMLRLGWSLMLISGLFLLMSYFILGLTVSSSVIAMALFYFGSSFIWPNTFAGAMQPFAKMAGFAGSLYAFLQMAGAVVVGAAASWLASDTPVALGLVFVFSALLAWTVFEVVIKPQLAAGEAE
ncbi:multidrug effflux MFS transporter [Piscirickettsia litoralis]|uniref:Bcr/CflA family efflux transporter n=1 Tax=Piscirickettsia litoralis TaxID=1891921 RepID=A0ABX3A4D9_9GAMM|nr:multidrug effflux MFS transporter [Piscirickettsia litoralis]ODN43726.1 hypothetical protein BGC07_13500 [Piscirickettsia litoralis]